jgi:hypothetical protein
MQTAQKGLEPPSFLGRKLAMYALTLKQLMPQLEMLAEEMTNEQLPWF